MPIRVLLVDDHQIVREGLRVLLERAGFAIVGEAGDGNAASALAQELQPDVAVMDISLPLLNGLAATEAIGKLAPHTRCVILSMHAEREYVLRSLRLGARGFVSKKLAAGQLVLAIREVMRGRTYLSPEMSQNVIEAYQSHEDAGEEPLSSRERQVLQLVAEGKTNKEIAGVLHISVKTAETHRARAMVKLKLHDTAGLVRYAIRHGFVEA